MAQGLRLELRQSQSQQLVMTPQLQQAIRLLQMSNVELGEFIELEIETNPLIEIDRGEAPETPEPRRDPPAEGPPGDDPGRAAEALDGGAENLYESADRGGGADWTPAAGGIGTGVGRGGTSGFEDDLDGADPRLSAELSLDDHLIAQIGQMRAGPAETRLAIYLVRHLDEHGFLRLDLDELAGRLGAPRALLDRAHGLVRACDPTGVGARDLADCLALQLAERNRLDPAMQTLLANLALLSKGEHKRLRALCGVDADDYDEMLAEIRALNPRPCAGFDRAEAETLVPDVLMRRAPDGSGWQVELNPDTLPKVLIDQRYAARLSRGGAEVETWLAERRAQASWLIRSLDQRARTILKVATEILRQQERFFEEGVSGLRPLTLRAVAEATGLHESTVSRVTSNKYMATGRGIFELKFFFTNAIGGAAGGEDGVSATAVRHRLRALVDAEAPTNILSDDTLVEMLRAEGIDIARRTVAKYRKNLKIPSSVERRRQKAPST